MATTEEADAVATTEVAIAASPPAAAPAAASAPVSTAATAMGRGDDAATSSAAAVSVALGGLPLAPPFAMLCLSARLVARSGARAQHAAVSHCQCPLVA